MAIEEHLQAVPSFWVKNLPAGGFCGCTKDLVQETFGSEVTAFNCGC